MADVPAGEIKGLAEVLGKLKVLEQEPRKKTTRFALRKAANLVRDAAQANAAKFDDPTTESNISEAIAVKNDTRYARTTGDFKMSVGVKGGAKAGSVSHWRFLEFGTSKMAARPFMRPAMESNTDAATGEFVRQFEKAITRAVKKANKAKA